MVIVDRVEHQVFVVPAEGSVFHAYVQPWQVYAINVLAPRELHQTVFVSAKVVQVPRVLLVKLLLRVQYFLASFTKRRAKLTSRYVSSILHFKGFTSLIVHHLPVVFLQFLVVLWCSFL